MILGAFVKLRGTTISFIMSVCPSFRMQQLVTRWTDLHETYYMNILRKSVGKIPVSLKSDKTNEYFSWLHMRIYSNIALNSS